MYLSISLFINLFTYSPPHNDLHPTKKSTPPKFSSRKKIRRKMSDATYKPLIIATSFYFQKYSLLYLPQFFPCLPILQNPPLSLLVTPHHPWLCLPTTPGKSFFFVTELFSAQISFEFIVWLRSAQMWLNMGTFCKRQKEMAKLWSNLHVCCFEVLVNMLDVLPGLYI